MMNILRLAWITASSNRGIGLYLIVEEADVDHLLTIGRVLDYPVYHLGHVEDGEPKTVVHIEQGSTVTVYPPGD